MYLRYCIIILIFLGYSCSFSSKKIKFEINLEKLFLNIYQDSLQEYYESHNKKHISLKIVDKESTYYGGGNFSCIKVPDGQSTRININCDSFFPRNNFEIFIVKIMKKTDTTTKFGITFFDFSYMINESELKFNQKVILNGNIFDSCFVAKNEYLGYDNKINKITKVFIQKKGIVGLEINRLYYLRKIQK